MKVNSTEDIFDFVLSEPMFGIYTIELIIHGNEGDIGTSIDILIFSLGTN